MDKIKKIVQGLAQNLKKINKLSLPAVILIASIILGGFIFASQVNKRRSIERQQEIKIEQEKQEPLTKEQREQKLQNCLAEANNWYDEEKQNIIKILEEEKKRYNPYQEFIDKNATSRDEIIALLLEELEDYKAECFRKYPQK